MKKKTGIIAVLLAGASIASGAFQINVEKSAMHYDSDSATAVNTISGFTVVAGSGRKLVLSVNYESATVLSTVTYGGQSFIKAVDNAATRAVQIWYLDDPAVGTADIVATFSGNARSLMGVVSLQNAAAGGPVVSNKTAVSSARSITLTTPAPNTFVIGCYTENNTGPITGPFVNSLYNGNSGSSWSDAGYQNEASAGQKTYTWSALDPSAAIAVAGFAAIPPQINLIALTPGQ